MCFNGIDILLLTPLQLTKRHKPIFSIQEEPPAWGEDSDDVGLESVSEPDLDRDGEDVEDEEDSAFFSNSPSPAPPSPAPPLTEDSSSLDIASPNPLTAHRPDPVHSMEDDEVQESLEDDEEWVDPLPPPPLSHVNGLSVDLAPLRENNKGKSKARKANSTPSPTPPQHFPFPSSDDNEEMNMGNGSRGIRDRGETRPSPHIRSIRARNGGRTQSGGVKGVWRDGGDVGEP